MRVRKVAVELPGFDLQARLTELFKESPLARAADRGLSMQTSLNRGKGSRPIDEGERIIEPTYITEVRVDGKRLFAEVHIVDSERSALFLLAMGPEWSGLNFDRPSNIAYIGAAVLVASGAGSEWRVIQAVVEDVDFGEIVRPMAGLDPTFVAAALAYQAGLFKDPL